MVVQPGGEHHGRRGRDPAFAHRRPGARSPARGLSRRRWTTTSSISYAPRCVRRSSRHPTDIGAALGRVRLGRARGHRRGVRVHRVVRGTGCARRRHRRARRRHRRHGGDRRPGAGRVAARGRDGRDGAGRRLGAADRQRDRAAPTRRRARLRPGRRRAWSPLDLVDARRGARRRHGRRDGVGPGDPHRHHGRTASRRGPTSRAGRSSRSPASWWASARASSTWPWRRSRNASSSASPSP